MKNVKTSLHRIFSQNGVIGSSGFTSPTSSKESHQDPLDCFVGLPPRNDGITSRDAIPSPIPKNPIQSLDPRLREDDGDVKKIEVIALGQLRGDERQFLEFVGGLLERCRGRGRLLSRGKMGGQKS